MSYILLRDATQLSGKMITVDRWVTLRNEAIVVYLKGNIQAFRMDKQANR